MANGDSHPTAPAQPLADAIGFGFQTVIEGLRSDVREDFRELRIELAQSELRMTERVVALSGNITEARNEWNRFAVDHGHEHEGLTIERREAHGAFYQFIKDAELDAARRDGALGVVRFLIEKTSANATRLVAVIVALAAALATVTGNVHFVVGR